MKKILVASASRVFLNRILSLLKQRGIQLFAATSGGDALRLHAEDLVDLIISDLELEGMDGCTLCSLLLEEENPRHVPVILICHNRSDSIERVERSGARAMLLKPINPIQLLKTIETFTGLQLVRSIRVELRVKVLCKKQDLEFFCFSHDISNAGILIETENQLELGSRIICQFTLPGSCQIESEGEICRCMNTAEGKYLYGVKFIALPLSYHKAIATYISILLSGTIEQNIYKGYSS